MPGQLIWGYYPTDKVWLPIVVNAEGKLIIDPSEVTLDKLGDVDAPSPADGDVLYWDATAKKWKSKPLP